MVTDILICTVRVALQEKIREIRRKIHKHPETGWKEFRTTALIARKLDDLGYTLYLGGDALDITERLGVPCDGELKSAKERAHELGAPETYLDEMGLITGIVAEKTFGSKPGPVIGLRFDMDALRITESSDDAHQPAEKGFRSKHPNEMHACGHDGHTAIGLGVAKMLETESEFSGTVKFFFQPAEEGGRGGLPMSNTDHLDDIDYFIGIHLGLGNQTGKIVAGYDNPLSNAKIDVEFHGESAHAGRAPNQGQNALTAATTAVQNLYAIPRHEAGATRVNVGRVESPNMQNVISDMAEMRVEVRGETTDLNEYMLNSSKRIIKHAAAMHEVECNIDLYGKTTTFSADAELASVVADTAESINSVESVIKRKQMQVSEDVSYLIRRVQDEGGQGTFIGIGTDHPAGHHTPRFDIDEDSLEIGTEVIVRSIKFLSNKN